MYYGNKSCTFKDCNRPTVSYWKTMHHFESGPPIVCWDAVCADHLDALLDPDDKRAQAKVRALMPIQ